MPGLGPNRFILIREFLIREVNQNLFLFLIHLGESFYFWFTYKANESHWFILIWFDFDSSRIMIHLRIKNQTESKSKVGESWFAHCRIIGWFNFESKANKSESWIKLVRALGHAKRELLELSINIRVAKSRLEKGCKIILLFFFDKRNVQIYMRQFFFISQSSFFNKGRHLRVKIHTRRRKAPSPLVILILLEFSFF